MFGFWEFGGGGEGEVPYTHLKIERRLFYPLIWSICKKNKLCFSARGWVKDPVLFKPHSMNLKQDISSDGLKSFPQFGFTWRKICRIPSGQF